MARPWVFGAATLWFRANCAGTAASYFGNVAVAIPMVLLSRRVSCRAPELPPSLVPFIVPSQFYETACAKISQFSFGSLIFRWRANKQFESWILAMGETLRHPAVVNNWMVYKFLIWEMPWIVCRHVSFHPMHYLIIQQMNNKKRRKWKNHKHRFYKKNGKKRSVRRCETIPSLFRNGDLKARETESGSPFKKYKKNT